MCGGGGTLIFSSYICYAYFERIKILNFNIFGCFIQMTFFFFFFFGGGGYGAFCGYLWEVTLNWIILG